jgi:cysteine desulfurase
MAVAGATEHDAVLRLVEGSLPVDTSGRFARSALAEVQGASLLCIQHVNSETGVIQPIQEIATATAERGCIWLADCAQSAGKLPLPSADLIAIGAHKFGGPPGVGALLVRELALLRARGGQEQGYRGGTENLPAIMAMVAALEAPREWLAGAVALRARLDAAIVAGGGTIVAGESPRLATIASYRMPGVAARVQLIRFDLAGFAISAGSACSSGTLKGSHVLPAMGWDAAAADEVVRVSFGPQTTAEEVDLFIEEWQRISEQGRH